MGDKTKKTPVRRIKYGPKIGKFIKEKMISEGLRPSELCRKYPTHLPKVQTLYRWQSKYPDLLASVTEGYQGYTDGKIAELEALRHVHWIRDHIDEFDGNEKLAMHAQKTSISALQFLLSQVCPVLDRKFTQKQEIQVTGDALGPQIIIASYATGKVEKDITPKSIK